MLSDIWDIIVVGGGLAGSVLTSRLAEQNSSLKILLLEAGPDLSNNTDILYASFQPFLIGSEWDWKDVTIPQTNLNNREIVTASGKGLGGGTIINSCGWVRGDASDYDLWAEAVDDDRWSYEGQLPYFRKMEHTYNSSANRKQHGFTGPTWFASVSSTSRIYPLRDDIKTAWEENGVYSPADGDVNDGSPRALGEVEENRRNGLRQLASTAYNTTSKVGVTVLTNTLVGKVITTRKNGKLTATGVKLANGTTYIAGTEVILSAGAYRTPQLLMLSGIGPKAELNKHGITQVADVPDVGKNLADHMVLVQYWKLKKEVAEQGVALGSNNPLFNEEQFGLGLPIDWIVTETVPTAGLRTAIKADGETPGSSHPLLKKTKSFVETLVFYAASNPGDPYIAYNGSHIMSFIIGLLPTSRGTVTLNSADPADRPVINPNYYATNVDRYAFRYEMRRVAQLMLGTTAARSFIERETPPDEFEPITINASDEYLDARVAESAGDSYHPMGTAAMGKVVDTNLRVKGVRNLRVVDASIFPVAIAAHLQQAVYAMAEQAAVIIGGDL